MPDHVPLKRSSNRENSLIEPKPILRGACRPRCSRSKYSRFESIVQSRVLLESKWKRQTGRYRRARKGNRKRKGTMSNFIKCIFISESKRKSMTNWISFVSRIESKILRLLFSSIVMYFSFLLNFLSGHPAGKAADVCNRLWKDYTVSHHFKLGLTVQASFQRRPEKISILFSFS